MGVKKPTKATVRKQLKDTALAAIAALDSAWAADAPMERLRDGAEALKALAEVLGQIESAEKLAETAFTIFASEDFHQQIIKISPEMVERGEME